MILRRDGSHRLLFIEVPEAKSGQEPHPPRPRAGRGHAATTSSRGCWSTARSRSPTTAASTAPAPAGSILADPEGNEFCILRSLAEREAAQGRSRRRPAPEPEPRFEVDPHDGPAQGRAAHLDQSGGGERRHRPDVQLLGDGRRWSSSGRPRGRRPPRARVLDRGPRQRPAHAPSSGAGPGEQAGHGPDPRRRPGPRRGRPTGRGRCAPARRTPVVARPHTTRPARRRGARPARSSPTPGRRTPPAHGAGRPAPAPGSRPNDSRGASL